MNIRKRVLALSCAALLFAWVVLPAIAAPQRTFVSTSGNDLNPCSLNSPCRGFAAAVAVVAAGGEVIVLDSGGYGLVTISKSVSITAPPGIYAGISVPGSGTGIVINAGASDVVSLRNLTIFGVGMSILGIKATNVGELRIDGLHVSGVKGFGFVGLWFATAGTLTVANSVFEGHSIGVNIAPPVGATATVVMRDTQLTSNEFGYEQIGPGTTFATITRASASANSSMGFLINGTMTDRLVLESCVAAENILKGVFQGSGALVLSGNSITGNGIGVESMGGTALTRGNNTIIQNGMDVVGGLTPIPGGGT